MEVNVRIKHSPERTCIGCRQKQTVDNLLHLACTPDGSIIIDRWGRLPGRGAHVCFKTSCIHKAVRPASLAIAFKRPLKVPDYAFMYETAIDLLNERMATYLSMAQKAGFVISGYAPLQRALTQGKIVCMVLAADIAGTREQKYQTWCAQYHIPALTCFTKTRLGMIIGKSSRSAVGLTESKFYGLLSATKASLDTLLSCDPSTQTKS